MARPVRRSATYEDLRAVPEHLVAEILFGAAIAGWRRERLPALPETSWIETPPDWICEILSPSTERYDRDDKRLIYAEAGVAHLWHVIPVLRLLEAFELRDGKWLLLDVFRDEAPVPAAPLGEISFALNLLWPFDPPPATQG